MANINGWGRGTWGQLTFGEPLPVTLTAPGAGTSALGTVAVDAEANVTPSVGSLSVAVDGEAIVTLTGSGTVGTSAIGTATTVSNNNLSVTLNAATGSVGSATIDAEANVVPTGVSATGSVGTVLVWSQLDEDQTSNFSDITETQSPSWKDVAA